MQVNKNHNILWIVLDGVRNYPCPDDPQRMGRPPLFDEIAKNGIYFENVATSGTSTIMAVSGMMMSIPSYYLSRNLRDFRIDKSSYESFASIQS